MTSKKRKARKRRRIILFAVEMVALVVLGVVLWAVMKQTSMQKINVKEEDIVINDTVENNVAMKGYRNIALFGLDARDKNLGKGNRSDTIMIASINLDTGEVKLCSVYRDTYMNLGNDKYSKCNAAYASGGPEQAISMLNMNLDMNITDYVSIGFNGMIDVVNSLGGVEIDIREDEIKYLNDYQASMFSTETKERLTNDYVKVTQPGVQTLNGLQATAYCRIRYTAGDDFKRAERQRTVLLAILEKARTASVGTLNDTLDKVLPNVATNLDTKEMLSVLKDLASYKVVATDGFPFETNRVTGKVGKAGSCVIPTSLEDNVVLLHKFFFEQEEYTPSKSVSNYSARVSSDTGR
ncbi:transcriptional regulator [Eisenbergiella tayi]|nr:transcriptional regulator [Eisenbergiella tayi]